MKTQPKKQKLNRQKVQKTNINNNEEEKNLNKNNLNNNNLNNNKNNNNNSQLPNNQSHNLKSELKVPEGKYVMEYELLHQCSKPIIHELNMENSDYSILDKTNNKSKLPFQQSNSSSNLKKNPNLKRRKTTLLSKCNTINCELSNLTDIKSTILYDESLRNIGKNAMASVLKYEPKNDSSVILKKFKLSPKYVRQLSLKPSLSTSKSTSLLSPHSSTSSSSSQHSSSLSSLSTLQKKKNDKEEEDKKNGCAEIGKGFYVSCNTSCKLIIYNLYYTDKPIFQLGSSSNSQMTCHSLNKDELRLNNNIEVIIGFSNGSYCLYSPIMGSKKK